MVAAAVVAGAAVSAAAGAASSSSQAGAAKKGAAAQQQAFAQQQQALNSARNQARSDLQPYATAGTNALNELNWQLGLPSEKKSYSSQDVPDTYIQGQSGDPVWEKLLATINQQHQAHYGIPMNRPWESDADSQKAYGELSQQYLAIKNAEAQNQPDYQGQGSKGSLLTPYDMSQYKQDAGYTPMVNSLAELQATPGYQFQLEQGLQSANQSAAANGSLLSSGQLKGLNNYAQDYASTGYQAAWDRAQQAYQNAFARNQTNKSNTYNMLSGVAGAGQTAATNQGNASVNTANALAGAAGNNGVAQSNAFNQIGQAQANLYTGIGNAVTSGLGAYSALGGNGIGKTAGNGTGIVSSNNSVGNAVNNYLPQNSYVR